MKINKRFLKKIIKEEVEKLVEGVDAPLPISYAGPMENPEWLGIREVTNRDVYEAIMRVQASIQELHRSLSAPAESEITEYEPARPEMPPIQPGSDPEEIA